MFKWFFNLRKISKRKMIRANYINEGTYSTNTYNKFIVIDFETTGLSYVADEIIEVAAVKFEDGQIKYEYHTLINPLINIPSNITSINNISNSMVKKCPCIEEVLEDLYNFIGDYPLVAHTAKFDIGFLNANLLLINKCINNKLIDTLNISRALYQELNNHKLITIKNHIDFKEEDSHRAFPDCIVASKIYMEFCNRIENRKLRYKETFSDLENTIYNKIEKTLMENDMNTDYLKINALSKYTDFAIFNSILSLKLVWKKTIFSI